MYQLVMYPSFDHTLNSPFGICLMIPLYQVGDEVTVLDATGKFVMPG